MYFARLEHYTKSDWDNLLFSFPDEQKSQIKQILTLPRKDAIEVHFEYLKSVGIINGIGADWMGRMLRKIITSLFTGVKFEFHDLEYFIGGYKADQQNADFGLFKYSILSIAENFKKINQLEMNFLIKELFTLLYTPFAIVKLIVLILFWKLLVYFGTGAFSPIFYKN